MHTYVWARIGGIKSRGSYTRLQAYIKFCSISVWFSDTLNIKLLLFPFLNKLPNVIHSDVHTMQGIWVTWKCCIFILLSVILFQASCGGSSQLIVNFTLRLACCKRPGLHVTWILTERENFFGFMPCTGGCLTVCQTSTKRLKIRIIRKL